MVGGGEAVTKAGLNSLRGICCICKLALACFNFPLFGNQLCFIAPAGTARRLSKKRPEASGDPKSLEQGRLGGPRGTVSALNTRQAAFRFRRANAAQSAAASSLLHTPHDAFQRCSPFLGSCSGLSFCWSRWQL